MLNKKKKKVQDLITEEEFDLEMRGTSTVPKRDSPGDTESDAGREFRMGLNYMPDEEKSYEREEEEEGDESEEDEPAPTPPSVMHGLKKEIPADAEVENSGSPAPWLDLDEKVDSH